MLLLTSPYYYKTTLYDLYTCNRKEETEGSPLLTLELESR